MVVLIHKEIVMEMGFLIVMIIANLLMLVIGTMIKMVVLMIQMEMDY